jgi:hypothetical protein
MNEVAIRAIRESSIPVGTLAVWFGISKERVLEIKGEKPKPKKKPKPTHFMGWKIDD